MSLQQNHVFMYQILTLSIEQIESEAQYDLSSRNLNRDEYIYIYIHHSSGRPEIYGYSPNHKVGFSAAL